MSSPTALAKPAVFQRLERDKRVWGCLEDHVGGSVIGELRSKILLQCQLESPARCLQLSICASLLPPPAKNLGSLFHLGQEMPEILKDMKCLGKSKLYKEFMEIHFTSGRSQKDQAWEHYTNTLVGDEFASVGDGSTFLLFGKTANKRVKKIELNQEYSMCHDILHSPASAKAFSSKVRESFGYHRPMSVPVVDHKGLFDLKVVKNVSGDLGLRMISAATIVDQWVEDQ
ncbi:hypothetical protein Tco_0360073 [Tanacetum coccineum]